MLASEGNVVEILAESQVSEQTTPDYGRNGTELWELKTLDPVIGNNKDLGKVIKDRLEVGVEQAPNVIVDGRKVPQITAEKATEGIDRPFGADSNCELEKARVLGPNGVDVFVQR